MSDELSRPASPTLRLTTWTLIAMLLTILVGSVVAKTEIVARGRGKLVPLARVQLVQPQVDGKISRVLVTQGQTVKAGDLLVAMDTVRAESEMARIAVNMAQQSQAAAVARAVIAAIEEKRDPTDQSFMKTGLAAFAAETALAHDSGGPALVETILAEIRAQAAELNAEWTQTIRDAEVQKQRLQKARIDQEISGQRFASAKQLKDSGMISELDYLNRLREQKSVEAEHVIAARELDKLANSSDVLRKRRESTLSAALAKYRRQLNDAQVLLQSLQAESQTAKSVRADLMLHAPVDGRIEKLSVLTDGGFVEAGTTLMTVVPSHGGVEIEAFFDNRDVGFLANGQKVSIKFDAFPPERFGIVNGRVLTVGADARSDVEPGKWVYTVRIKSDQDSIHIAQRQIPFSPGMTASVDVVTGERSVISYFFEPILRALQDSFKER